MRISPAARTSTQEVLPPYRIVVGPGVGIDPRTPQNLTRVPEPGLLSLVGAVFMGIVRCEHNASGFGTQMKSKTSKSLNQLGTPLFWLKQFSCRPTYCPMELSVSTACPIASSSNVT